MPATPRQLGSARGERHDPSPDGGRGRPAKDDEQPRKGRMHDEAGRLPHPSPRKSNFRHGAYEHKMATGDGNQVRRPAGREFSIESGLASGGREPAGDSGEHRPRRIGLNLAKKRRERLFPKAHEHAGKPAAKAAILDANRAHGAADALHTARSSPLVLARGREPPYAGETMAAADAHRARRPHERLVTGRPLRPGATAPRSVAAAHVGDHLKLPGGNRACK